MKKSELKQLIKEAIEEVEMPIDYTATNQPPIDKHELVESFEPDTDEVGAFWVVEKPTTNAELNDICFECSSVAEFARLVKGGLNESDVKGIFTKEAKAKKLAEKLLAERDKKKDEVKVAAEAYKKMKEETLAKVQEYMKNKKATKDVVDELKDVTK
jgi:vacuolar-type H+-ATPase subunit I/STV1